MYNTIERDSTYQSHLLEFIQQEYAFHPVSINPAKRGYFGETWRLDSADKSYFLKLDYTALHQSIYANSFHIIRHLCDNGIDFISRIVKTANGELYTIFDSAVLGVFEWIDGENAQDERTKISEYQMLAKVYTVHSDGLSIPKEDFSTHSADLFFAQCDRLKSNPDNETAARLIIIFEKNQAKINHRAKRLKLFSGRCQRDASGFFITHGDAGGNVIMNGDNFHMVDWDDPVLAPPERDAWFCLYWDWAMAAFNDALRQNGISYTLRPERLAYYCYHSFFGT